jgi:hypothetical protein
MKKICSLWAIGLSILAASLLFADPNPTTSKKDPSAFAYFDTTINGTAGGDTVTFGFLADWACVTSPTSGTCNVQWIGKQITLRNTGSGAASNPRAGLKHVQSVLYAMPVSATYCTGNVTAAFYGVKITGTGTSILIQAGRFIQ